MPERSGKGEAARVAPGGTTADGLPVLSFATTGAWSRWLAAHHASSRGVWLKIAKKGASSGALLHECGHVALVALPGAFEGIQRIARASRIGT